MEKLNELQSYLTRLRGLMLTLIILCSIGSGNVWGTSAVNSQAPANGKSFIIALYYSSEYYALPHITSTNTYAGKQCTLDANGKVTAIADCSHPNECLWTFASSSSNWKISYENSGTYYLQKSGTTGNTNYKIQANTTNNDSKLWSFTSGTANSKKAYYMSCAYSSATKNKTMQGNSSSTFQVRTNNKIYAITLLEVAPSTITCATTSLSGFTYQQGSGPSTAQSFSVSGSTLTANITVTAPTNYEVSTSSGSGYGSSVTLTKNATGAVAATTVYVRLKSGLSANTYSESISITSSGATTKSISLSGTVTAGSTWKFKCSSDSWTEHTMTESAGTASYSISLAADSRFEFGIDDNGTFYKNNGTIITTTSGWVFNTSDNNCKIHTGPAGTYTFAINTTTKAVTVTYPTVDHPNDHYVYFKNTNVWETVYGYLGNSGNDNKAAAWPGSVMQATTTICGETYHYAALNAMSGTYNVINFNNGGSGYGNQTSDLSTDGLGKYNANTDANWHQFKYSITFAGNGNTGGSMTDVENLCPGTNQTLASNGFTKTDHTFTGWKANVDVKIGGSTVTAGTLITNAATIQDIQSDITLTAQWEHVPVITVSQTSRAFGDRKVSGGPYEMTFTVSGSYLKGNISLAVSGTNAAMFSVSPTSLSPTTGTVSSTEITVSYSPTGAGSHSAQVDITSSSATSKTVTLSGTGKWEVIWSVNGVETPTLVANSTKPTLPSPDPSSCDLTSTTFKGWATSSWAGKLDDVSAKTIHTSNSTMSNITANGTTFYAVWAKETAGASTSKTYSFEITGSDFTTGGYAVNNGEHTSTATATDASGATMTVYWTSYQVYQNSGMQWQKNTGYIYNTTDLGSVTAANVSITSTAGSYNKYIGSSSNPSSSGTGGFFKVAIDNTETGKMSSLAVTFTKTTTAPTTYTQYLTTCGACTADPDMTDAASALKGAFSLSSVGVTATDWNTGSAFCSWVDYGFVWGTSANPTVSNNKVQVGTSGSATTWDGALTGSFSVDLTYHFRAYGKNAKDAAAFQYSADQTFIPRSVTFNLNGHGSSTPSTQYVPNGGKAADPSYSEVVAGWAFGGWYDNADWTQGTQWNFGTSTVSGASVTLYAKWTEKPKYTITLNAGNGTVSADGWTAGDSPTWSKTQANGDEEITLPSASCNCAGWEFQGWAASSVDQAGAPTMTSSGASVLPASNTTYYAVYRQNATGGTTYNKITSTGDLTTGDYLFVANGGYAMQNTVNGKRMDEVSGFTSSNPSQTTDNTSLVWTIAKFNSQVVIKNGSNYLGIDADNTICMTTTPHFFTYTYNAGSSRWEFTSVTKTSYQLTYSTAAGTSYSYFCAGTSQSTAIYLYKQGAGLTGNYKTNPICSDITVTGAVSPAGSGTVTLTAGSGKTGDKVYAMYTPDEDYNFDHWSISGTGSTLSSTTALVTEITIGSAATTVTANFVAKDWKTVTWKANGVALTGGDLGSASVKVENGFDITALPPTPTSCDGTSTTFIGWLPDGEEWSSTLDDVSAKHIYAKASDFPTVTANVTYHAVWAKKTGSSGNETLTCTAGTVEGSTAADKTITMSTTNFTIVNANTYGSQTAVASYSPWRFYEKHTITISGTYLITQVDLEHSETYYGSLSSDKGTLTAATTSGGTTTITDINSTSVEIANAASASQARISSIKIYYDNSTYSKYLVKCCDDPELTFTTTEQEVVRQDLGGAKGTHKVIEFPYTTSSGGTLTAEVKRMASYGSRDEAAAGYGCTAYTSISVDATNNKVVLEVWSVNDPTTSGQWTYRVKLHQDATDALSGNYCASDDYSFVDVILRDKFVDAVNGNATINRDGKGVALNTPSESDMDVEKDDDCGGQTRRLLGWIRETDLETIYGSPGETGYLEGAAAYEANKDKIVVPGTGSFITTGCTWYAVWGVDNTPEP